MCLWTRKLAGGGEPTKSCSCSTKSTRMGKIFMHILANNTILIILVGKIFMRILTDNTILIILGGKMFMRLE